MNGQHTLDAVILSRAAIECIVLTNCSAAAFMVIDGGMKRSSEDHFGMAGKSYPRGTGATVRRALMGLRNFAGEGITDLVVDEFMQVHGDAVRFAHSAAAKSRFGMAAVRAVLVRAKIDGVPGEQLERFVEVLDTGIMGAGENGAVLLRNHMMAMKGNVADSGTARRDLYALTESALSVFLNKQRPAKINPTKTELYPMPGYDK